MVLAPIYQCTHPPRVKFSVLFFFFLCMWYYATVNQSVEYCMDVFIYMCKHIYLYIHIYISMCACTYTKETFLHICTCENIYKFKQGKKKKENSQCILSSVYML